MRFSALRRSRTLWLALVGILALAAGVAALWNRARVHPLLASPTLLLEQVKPGSLYFNGEARPWIMSHRPELVTTEDREEKSARTRGLVQAVQNPKLFRQLDRQYRFDSLVLVGDPSQYRPLLEHLVESRDFTLSYVDHTGYVYQRTGGAVWSVEDIPGVWARFSKASTTDHARFLSQTASKLIAIRQTGPANQLLDQARALNSGIPDVRSTEAFYQLALGRWSDAIGAADRALEIDDEWQPALAAKAQALYATKYFADAYDISQRLIEQNPQDPGLLFYHAKIAHEARAFTDEIRVLKRLIERAEKEQRPTSGYRLYLAQAYASDGQGEPAIEQFRLAMEDPELPKEQRQFALETTAQIKSRIGLSK